MFMRMHATFFKPPRGPNVWGKRRELPIGVSLLPQGGIRTLIDIRKRTVATLLFKRLGILSLQGKLTSVQGYTRARRRGAWNLKKFTKLKVRAPSYPRGNS